MDAQIEEYMIMKLKNVNVDITLILQKQLTIFK